VESTLNLLPGTVVSARGLRWEVVTSQNLGPQTLLRLRGTENAVLGQELDILCPFESVEPVRHDLRPDRAAPLDNWLVYHQAFLLEQALGPAALLAVQPGRLRLEAYQLVPVLRAIRMSRARLLLADGVGLGKTVQAGLVITELIARRLAHRVLVVSPAGPLLEQWQMEMSERFGLRLQHVDRAKLDEIRRGTELGSNPFDHVPLALVSVDFLKQERILDQLERTSYDIVVIDEAHHCTDIGAGQDREDSLRRRLAEVLSRRCDSLLLLTATPHDGNDRSFASLCELLDPSLVDGRGTLRGERYRGYVVRRLKKHIIDPETKQSRFKERRVTPIPVTADSKHHPDFVRLQRGLLDLVAPELRRAFRNKNYSDVLAFIALLKRSVSTVNACRETLSVVADRFQLFLTDTAEKQELRRQRIKTLRDYERRLERFGSIGFEEETDRSVLEAEDLAQQLAGMQREIRRGSREQAKVSDVVAHLDDLVELSQGAVKHDPKLDRLVATIRDIRQEEPDASILVYTEYIDSQRAAVDALKDAKLQQILTMSGEDKEAQRSKVTELFRTRDRMILVSTDSAAEGLNLHQRCHHLIHLELPFNPNRLEQRNGRIDRYGQKLEPHVRYLYLRGTFEERILLRLIAKYERQRAKLTFVPNTLGITSTDAAQARLLKGLIEEETQLFKTEEPSFSLTDGKENEGADDATRELLEEIDRSLHGFEKAARSHAWLGDAGLNAEEQLVREADEARARGSKAEHVDLATFVCNAVRLDGGDVKGNVSDPFFIVKVPPAWIHGLEDLPGYDPEGRFIRLTTRLDVTCDDRENSIGFLGRAHPLVRRAIDRVRVLSFGANAKQGQDQRVSAVKAKVPQPQLLFTFLGRVNSLAGRELEKVLAVKVTANMASEFYDSPDDWAALTDSACAIRTTELWKTHFASWGTKGQERALATARTGFSPAANQFVDDRRKVLTREQTNQAEWLKKRAEEVTGTSTSPSSAQGSLFDPVGTIQAPASPAWQTITDPQHRLAAFHADRQQPAAARAEAEGVLRIYDQRTAYLNRLLNLRDPEIIPLGVLMLIPEVKHGA
jgi:superfamily II DNA or RNA helicase